MKIKDAIKDYHYVLYVGVGISVCQFLVLLLGQLHSAIIIMFLLLTWIMILSFISIDYLRKKQFYKDVVALSNNLDQGYYVHELLDEPNFIEGKIFYNVLQATNKNYLDDLRKHELNEKDYQEFIELWVHEIKTPLAASKLLVENEQSEFSKKLDEELDRISDFVDEALYYGRSAYTHQDYLVKKLNLKDVVYESIKHHQRSFLQKEIKVEVSLEDCFIYSDEKWLRFILHQLLDNTLKYTASKNTIKLYSMLQKDSLELMIEDEGIGIRESEVGRVFQRFFTGTNGRLYSKSTGMGLYLCKQLCDKLYIGLDLSSKEQVGTKITLRFPDSSMFHLK